MLDKLVDYFCFVYLSFSWKYTLAFFTILFNLWRKLDLILIENLKKYFILPFAANNNQKKNALNV